MNTLADYQVEFNGFLMGPGTAYDLPPGCDFFDMAAIKTMDQQRVWADGSWSGPDFAGVLTPTLPMNAHATQAVTLTDALSALRGVLSPQATAGPLWVKLPGMVAQGIPAKVAKRSFPLGLEWYAGSASGAVQFRCPDPAWQSVPRILQLAASGAASSGLSFPLFQAVSTVLDFGVTGLSSAAGTLTNAGNTPAFPYVVVTGPVSGFSIVIDGNTVTYTDTVAAGQTLTIDYRTGYATLTGGVDRTTRLSSRQFSAVTSTSSVFFSAAAGVAAITIADLWR
ncbi:phage-related protein [Leifsonia xyli subsp. xyli str. CTCB07]|uniref:Phage-related protein n=1 Tax=Leifsonia xyli subsp. xyli (strain CTCB07) TaxID=281090 RepID=Q6AC41_LEIXX|nr:phage-related protein [Leifsonia xyli subsp. xyli str. CTCB07]